MSYKNVCVNYFYDETSKTELLLVLQEISAQAWR